MKIHTRILSLSCGAVLLGALSFGQSYTFVTVDAPCDTCPGGIAVRTVVAGINPGGDIVGVYRDAAQKTHGFLLSRGQFTRIEVPGALVGAGGTLPTTARGISPSGDIVGQFTAPFSSAAEDSAAFCPSAYPAACIKGFLYSHGEYYIKLFPGHPGSVIASVTSNGDLYGCFHDLDTGASMISAAMTRSGVSSLAAGGGELSDPNQSFVCSMHGGVAPDGTLVGFWGDPADECSHTHGYILQNGVLQSYDIPDSTSTTVWGLTPGHEIVGTYSDNNFQNHGFVQFPGESAITVDVPSTDPFNAVGTGIMGVNPGGVIVGQYADASGHTHGFLGMPSTAD